MKEEIFTITEIETETDSQSYKWTKDKTIMLLDLVNQNFDQIENGVKRSVYQNIANEINTAFNSNVTREQVDSKWRGLRKTYSKMKEENETNGILKKTWDYYTLMEEILTRAPITKPFTSFLEEPSCEVEGFKWNKALTLALIDLIRDDFGQYGTKKTLYQAIANNLNSTFGTNLNYDQIDSKWKGLKKTYKRLKEEHSPTDQQRKMWYYFKLMDEILDGAPDADVKPPDILSTEEVFIEFNANEDEIDDCLDEQVIKNSRKRKRSSTADIFEDDPVERRHREIMEATNRFLNLFEKMVNKM